MPEVQPVPHATCSVVICTRSRPQLLKQLLEALSQQLALPLETIVVENGEKNPAVQEVANDFGAKYFHNPYEGLSIARNQGWLAASGEIVAFLDDDCVPEKTWLVAIARAFQDPAIMALGGRIVPPESDEESRALCMKLQGDGPTSALQLDKSDGDWFSKAAFARLGTGGNMAFRRKLMESWSGFDERLGLPHSSCEDLYAFLSLVAGGNRIAYVPDALVMHPCALPGLDQLHERVIRSAESAGMYLAFLFFEAKEHRGELMRFLRKSVGQRLLSKSKGNIDARSRGPVPLAPTLRGIFRYVRQRSGRENQERALRTSS